VGRWTFRFAGCGRAVAARRPARSANRRSEWTIRASARSFSMRPRSHSRAGSVCRSGSPHGHAGGVPTSAYRRRHTGVVQRDRPPAAAVTPADCESCSKDVPCALREATDDIGQGLARLSSTGRAVPLAMRVAIVLAHARCCVTPDHHCLRPRPATRIICFKRVTAMPPQPTWITIDDLFEEARFRSRGPVHGTTLPRVDRGLLGPLRGARVFR
jgi:hypothetical protein